MKKRITRRITRHIDRLPGGTIELKDLKEPWALMITLDAEVKELDKEFGNLLPFVSPECDAIVPAWWLRRILLRYGMLKDDRDALTDLVTKTSKTLASQTDVSNHSGNSFVKDIADIYGLTLPPGPVVSVTPIPKPSTRSIKLKKIVRDV